jgi:hypothetical protein
MHLKDRYFDTCMTKTMTALLVCIYNNWCFKSRHFMCGSCTGSILFKSRHLICRSCTGNISFKSRHFICRSCTGNISYKSRHFICRSCTGNISLKSRHFICRSCTGKISYKSRRFICRSCTGSISYKSRRFICRSYTGKISFNYQISLVLLCAFITNDVQAESKLHIQGDELNKKSKCPSQNHIYVIVVTYFLQMTHAVFFVLLELFVNKCPAGTLNCCFVSYDSYGACYEITMLLCS